MTASVVSLAEDRAGALGRAVAALRAGRLVVFPTDTVYGLGADAFSPFATAAIFRAKARPRSMPLPVLVADARQAWALAARVTPAAVALGEAFWPGALTLVLPESDALEWDLGETAGSVAVRVPDHPDLLDLLRRVGPVAGTSANVSGEPTPRSAAEIAARLGDAVAVYLDGGPAPGDVPSTIVDVAGEAALLRREGVIPRAEIERVAGMSVRTP